MSKSSKEAIEQLRDQVTVACVTAASNPLWDRTIPIEELREMADGHELGTTRSGWKNPYPASDPRSLLLEYQFVVFHDKSRFKASCQARQTGKDFTNEGEAVADCLATPGTQWMIAAPSERQSIDSLDQAKIWARAFDLTIADYAEEREAPHDSQSLLKSAEITFHDGSRMRAVPGKPDTVRGSSSNLLLTEFDFFENPQATWRAVLPSITNPLRGGKKKVRLCSTPNGKGSPLWNIMNKPDGKKMRWSRHLITIYHAVLMGLPVDIEELREALDDPEGFAQEFECEFVDSNNVLLPYAIIALAESAEATVFGDPDLWENGTGNPIVLGIDFGRTNDPSVCWALEGIGDIWWTREIWRERGMSTPEQARHLSRRVKHASRVCLDYTGPGIGLGDILVESFGEYKPSEHKFGKIELCTFTRNLKREMFPRLRRSFEAPVRLRVPIDIEVREDLHSMRQIVRNGAYHYEAPRTSSGHSDRCTALALANRAIGAAQSINLTATLI